MRTFYPTTSLQRHKLTVTALLTIMPRSSGPSSPGTGRCAAPSSCSCSALAPQPLGIPECSCQGSHSSHTTWRSRSWTKSFVRWSKQNSSSHSETLNYLWFKQNREERMEQLQMVLDKWPMAVLQTTIKSSNAFQILNIKYECIFSNYNFKFF